MRFIIIDLIILMIGGGGAWYGFQRLKEKNERKRLNAMPEAYFSGGPLDKTSRRVPELLAVQVVDGKHVYRYQGAGVYLYEGALDSGELLKYELGA